MKEVRRRSEADVDRVVLPEKDADVNCKIWRDFKWRNVRKRRKMQKESKDKGREGRGARGKGSKSRARFIVRAAVYATIDDNNGSNLTHHA